MGTAIVATANYWWVDAAAAGLIIFFCWGVAKVVAMCCPPRADLESTTGAYPEVLRTSTTNVRC